MIIRKWLYKRYNYLFFYLYKENFNYSVNRIIKWISKSKLGIKWLKIATKYYLYLWLKDLHKSYTEYKGNDTKGILQTPKHLYNMAKYSYLYDRIWMGWHPTLKSNSITLKEILKLNPYKTDKKWNLLLTTLLTHYWNNPDKCITKTTLDKFLC